MYFSESFKDFFIVAVYIDFANMMLIMMLMIMILKKNTSNKNVMYK